MKFNRALADHSMAQTPRLIDGIVLTKFDTIDDKVNVEGPELWDWRRVGILQESRDRIH